MPADIFKEITAVSFPHLICPAPAESASIDRGPGQDSNIPHTFAKVERKATSNQKHHKMVSKTSGRKEMGLDGRQWRRGKGGEGRMNERLNLISCLLKMSHHREDYCTASRTVGSRQREQVCPKSQGM